MEQSEAADAVKAILGNGLFDMFEKFDKLHQRGISDDDVARVLREAGHNNLANDYIDWQSDGEPVREDEDGPLDQGEDLVTDPGDAASYLAMEPIREDANLAGKWTNGLATIELTTQHIDRGLIGTVWNAVQFDAVFGGRNLLITPAGLRDAGYRRVE